MNSVHRGRRRPRPVILPMALATGGLLLALAPAGYATTPSATPPEAASAEPGALAEALPDGASIYVGNADDGPFSGFVDIHSAVDSPGKAIRTAVDEDDGMAVGDVSGDGADEVVVVDDGAHRVDVHDTSTGAVLLTFESRFNAEEDAIAVGNVTGDAKAEILVADEGLGQVTIHDGATGGVIRNIFGDTGFDSDDRFIVGDVTGDEFAELVVANNENGRVIDVFDPFGVRLDQVSSQFDGGIDDVAVGDVTGDGVGEIVVANDGVGRIDSHDLVLDTVHVLDKTSYDSDDKLGVGNAIGSPTDDIVIANTEENGRIDVIDLTGDVTEIDAGYDNDDRFAVVDGDSDPDVDGDGIPDVVELAGIRDSGGRIVQGWDLKALGANPCRKDVLVEIDYMDDSAADTDPHTHRPEDDAIDAVKKAFADAPVEAPVDECPYPEYDAEAGVGLHVVIDEDDTTEDEIEEQGKLDVPAGFNAIKAANFNAALDPYVHWNLWAHELDGDFSIAAGLANFTSDGQDFVVSLGAATGLNGTTADQSSTFMHELGHALGLSHGGGDKTNFKPNYVSVMNYSFQPAGAPFGRDPVTKDPLLDFSDHALDPLAKKSLDERAGIGETDLTTLWYDDAGKRHIELGEGALDWSGFNGDQEPDVEVNINADEGGLCVDENPADDDRKLETTAAGDDEVVAEYGFEEIHGGDDFTCDTTAVGGDKQEVPVGTEQVLEGYDDWENLDFLHGMDGRLFEAPNELSLQEQAEIAAGWDQALFPDTAVQVEAPVAGLHGAVNAIAMDEDHIYATHQYRTIATPQTTPSKGTLVVLDRETLAVEAHIGVGLGPRSVAVNPVTDRAYVVNGGDGAQQNYTISVIDTASLTVVHEIVLGQVPVDVAVNTRLNRVYVSNPYQQVIHVIDGATNLQLAPIRIGPGATGLAVDETTSTVYVALNRRGSGLPVVSALGTVVDDGVSKPKVLPPVTIGPEGVQPNDVAVDPVADRVYVGGLGGGGIAPTVTVFDQATRTQVEQISMRGPVRAISVNPDARLVVASGDRGVDMIDTGRLDVVRQIDGGLPFAAVTEAGPARQLYVGDFQNGQLRRWSYSSGQARS